MLVVIIGAVFFAAEKVVGPATAKAICAGIWFASLLMAIYGIKTF